MLNSKVISLITFFLVVIIGAILSVTAAPMSSPSLYRRAPQTQKELESDFVPVFADGKAAKLTIYNEDDAAKIKGKDTNNTGKGNEGNAKGGDAKVGDAKGKAKGDAKVGDAKGKAKGDAKVGDAKGIAKGDAKGKAKENAKGDAKVGDAKGKAKENAKEIAKENAKKA